MSSIQIAGDTSGSITLSAPAVAGTPTLTLPTTSGTIVTSGSPTFTGTVTAQTTSSVAPGGVALLLSDSTGSSANQFGIAFNSAVAGNAGSSRLNYYLDAGGATAGLTFLTGGATPTERARIDSSGYLSGTVNSLGKGIYQASQYYALNSGYAGSNATGAQKIFGVGVTLVGSTVYEFEMVFAMSKSAGTTSHDITLSFGGTATLNNIGFQVQGTGSSATANSVGTLTTTNNAYGFNTTSSFLLVAACVTATNGISYVVKGTVSVNAGGTFIPQYTLSAAPGGAYTTAAGSYMKISPLGASGANINIGTWA